MVPPYECTTSRQVATQSPFSFTFIISLKDEFTPHKTWHKPSWHHLLDSKLGPPASTVTSHKELDIKVFEILRGGLNLLWSSVSEMIPAHHRIQRRGLVCQGERVLRSIDGSSVAASREEDDAFAYTSSED